ncbi:MAG: type II secretion system F family protein, partial [Candidatus Omnitrophica bacterium]|nr:type II secretion system F family protein [Candidatus Omnitrophota bacterium]
MPKFSFVVKDNNGQTMKDTIEETSEAALITRLQSQGLFIISIKEIQDMTSDVLRKSFSQKRTYAHSKVQIEDLLTFSRQLATMLESGVTLTRSLTVIETQVASEQLSRILKQIGRDVEQGQSLSASLAKHPQAFNQFWVSLTEVGEASGTMPAILKKLTQYIEQESAFNSAILSGILYPAILFAVSMGAILFFALFVGPRFQAVFDSMGTKLPLLTTMLLSSFLFIKTHFLLIISAIIATFFFFKNYIKTYSGKLYLENFLFSLPVAGEIYKLIIVEKFTSQMAILIDAGVPILSSLYISEKLVDNITC